MRVFDTLLDSLHPQSRLRLRRLFPVVFLALAVMLVCGCATALKTPNLFTNPLFTNPSQVHLTAPNKHILTRGQLVIHGDFPLEEHERLWDDLIACRGDLNRDLALPESDEPIHVYLFADADKYKAFMRLRHPGFTQSRAGFNETDTRLEVYVQWGDRVGEDLRHEVMHGCIHGVVPNTPLWLDEGLAEYYEVPRGASGVNREHVRWLAARLKRGEWKPDLARLERLGSVNSMTRADGMTRADYAEAWAWVHFLLQSGGRDRHDLPGEYLRRLRQHGSAEPLCVAISRIDERASDELIMHIQRLASLNRHAPPH